MKTIRLKNYLLLSSQELVKGMPTETSGLVDWLVKQNLHGNESRLRTRFIKFLVERAEEINKEQTKLLEQYSDKNEKGEVLFVGKDGKDTTKGEIGGRYKITPENIEKYNKDYTDLLNEYLTIDLTPSMREMTEVIKKILLNATDGFKGKEAIYYDEQCSSFENEIEFIEEVKTEEVKK